MHTCNLFVYTVSINTSIDWTNPYTASVLVSDSHASLALYFAARVLMTLPSYVSFLPCPAFCSAVLLWDDLPLQHF